MMKKIILLALTAFMMVGCNIRHSVVYSGDYWDVLLMNDSIYLMIPKYDDYHTPYILKEKESVIKLK